MAAFRRNDIDMGIEGERSTAATSSATIAKNFATFLELLTTQLKNQNPLSPLDTNQFTQQLVQFAQVEQQINMNTSLGTMISLQQASQTSAAMGFLGTTVRVDGDTAKLKIGLIESGAGWVPFAARVPHT